MAIYVTPGKTESLVLCTVCARTSRRGHVATLTPDRLAEWLRRHRRHVS